MLWPFIGPKLRPPRENSLDFFSFYNLWIPNCHPGTPCKHITVECVLGPANVPCANAFG